MSILPLLLLTEKVTIGVCISGNGVLSSLGNLAGCVWSTWKVVGHFPAFLSVLVDCTQFFLLRLPSHLNILLDQRGRSIQKVGGGASYTHACKRMV